MTSNFSIWKIGPFGPSEEDDDAGVLFSGIGELFKVFMAPPSPKKGENGPPENRPDLNALQEAGIETSLMNVIGCNECEYKEECMLKRPARLEIVEKIEKEYGVKVVLRCPILMRELEK